MPRYKEHVTGKCIECRVALTESNTDYTWQRRCCECVKYETSKRTKTTVKSSK